MAKREIAFCLVDSNKPMPWWEIKLFFDMDDLSEVLIDFPAFKTYVSPDKLADLGCIFLALAGKDRSPRTLEILEGFGLQPPKHLHENDVKIT